MPALMSRREADRRIAAIGLLCALGVLQLAQLPYLQLQGRQIAALSAALAAGAVGLAGALALAAPSRGPTAWRAVAALGAVVCAGWLLTRAIRVPGVAEDAGHWTAPVALACAAVGVLLLALGAASAPPAAVRGVVAVAAVCVALAPGGAALLVALAPAPGHHHGPARAATAPHGAHDPAPAAPSRAFRPGFGGHAGHYVYANARPPRLPAWALGFAVGGGAVFLSLAGGALRRRSAPGPGRGPRRARAIPARAARGGAFVAVAACLFAIPAPNASAHASLVRAAPAALARPPVAPQRVVLAFSEPVQVVRARDVAVLAADGRRVDTGRARSAPGEGRVVTVPLRPGLPPDSYTVRYRVLSADAHALDGVLVFAVGGAALQAPAGGPVAGPAETGPAAVDARLGELVALGLLLALVAFRRLVWAPAVATVPGLAAADRERAIAEGRRRFWLAFWPVLASAGVAEAAVLVVKTGLVFGTGVLGALRSPSAVERLVASSRFGDLLGWRGGVLWAVAGVASWAWLRERAADDGRPAPGGHAAPVLGLLCLVALALVSAQGHASQAPLPALSVAADAVHLGAAAIWLGGLACLGVALRGAPRVVPGDAGRALAAAVLRRFSGVAAGAVVLVSATGLARALGELGAPSELWTSPYGRSLMAKALLLVPVAAVAVRNRRAVALLAGGGRATGAALRHIRRAVRLELALGLGIVVVAAVLVAQVPGRA